MHRRNHNVLLFLNILIPDGPGDKYQCSVNQYFILGVFYLSKPEVNKWKDLYQQPLFLPYWFENVLQKVKWS